MRRKMISFLSSYGIGIKTDQLLLRDDLARHCPEAEFRYYIHQEQEELLAAAEALFGEEEGPEMTEDPFVLTGVRYEKDRLIKQSAGVISMDFSFDRPGRRFDGILGRPAGIVVAAPYDYWFAEGEEALPGPKAGTQNLVLSSSPFMTGLLKNRYQVPAGQLIECCSPLAWEIMQEEKRREARRNLLIYFPEAEGKKILCLIKTGKKTKRTVELYKDFPLRTVLDACGDDWFFFTNLAEIMEAAASLPQSYASRFGYANGFNGLMKVAYTADAVISSCSELVCTFAGLGRPALGIAYRKNHFKQFMTKHYPDMFVTDPAALPDYLDQVIGDGGPDQAFAEQFRQPADKDPFAIVRKAVKL